MFSKEMKRIIYRAALAKEDVHLRFKKQPSHKGHYVFSGLRMEDGAELTMFCGLVMRMTEHELKNRKPNAEVDCVKCRLMESGQLFG
jgi:hypothetical protein